MKVKYEKPWVAVERYELSQTISACATKIAFLDSACVYNDPDAPDDMKAMAVKNWFTSGACYYALSTGQSYTGICYHTNANAAFSS